MRALTTEMDACIEACNECIEAANTCVAKEQVESDVAGCRNVAA